MGAAYGYVIVFANIHRGTLFGLDDGICGRRLPREPDAGRTAAPSLSQFDDLVPQRRIYASHAWILADLMWYRIGGMTILGWSKVGSPLLHTHVEVQRQRCTAAEPGRVSRVCVRCKPEARAIVHSERGIKTLQKIMPPAFSAWGQAKGSPDR